MKVGLVLEGGAMRGMYTAGVTDVMMEHQIHVDGVMGVSAGALFGCNYISNQPGRVIRYNKRFCRDKRYMGFHSLITTGNIMNQDFCFYEVPTKLDLFDLDTFSKSDTSFYVVVTNVETGKAEYIHITDFYGQIEYLRASGSMPYVSKIIETEGKKLLDGGMADSIPFQKMMELGYDKIIVVQTRPDGYRKKPSNNALLHCMYHHYPEFIHTMSNRYEMYNAQLDQLEQMYQQGCLYKINPSRQIDMARIEHNPDVLQSMYDLGREDAAAHIDEMLRYLA